MRRFLLAIFAVLVLALPMEATVSSTPSSTTWTGASCSGTDFTPSFNFVDYSHVSWTEDSVPLVLGTDYNWFTADTIRLTSSCGGGTLVAVRDSDPSNPIVTFTSGSRLTATSLNKALLQNIYAMEELEENTTVQGMNKLGGHWDAASLRIQNCSDALGDTDVACFGQLTIANADKYPGATTDNRIVKGNGTAYVEAETVPDAVVGDATKLLKVNAGGTGFEYAEKIANAGIGDAEKLVTVNSAGDGFDYDTYANYMAAWKPVWDEDFDSNTYTTTGQKTTLETSIVVPATGTWNLEVDVQVHWESTAATGARYEVTVALEQDRDGGGYSAIASWTGGESQINPPQFRDLLHGTYFGTNVLAGTYTFRINVTALTANTQLPAGGTSVHRMRAVAIRTN